MSIKDREEYLGRVSSYIRGALRFFARLGVTPVGMFDNREYSSFEVYFMLRGIPSIGPKISILSFLDIALPSNKYIHRLVFNRSTKLLQTKFIFKFALQFLTFVSLF
ncbi:MAG: hypothetical protein J7L07_00080 [Candidatus Odinarchaeota archaeon]|nr:hypothetical protein [Candidatus Odinarchaeota archaeon]